MLAYCRAHTIAVTNYSPLARGKRLHDSTLENIARKYRKHVTQVLIRWGLQRGNIVIPKAAKYRHLAENFDVFDFELLDEDLAILDALNEG